MGLCVNDSVSDYANSINHWYQKHGPRQSSHTGRPMHYPILTFWHDNSRDSSGSNSRADGISLLVDIDLSVPASPCSGGGEHPTTSTHVSKSSLAWPVGTTSPNTGDTGHSSSCTPGLSWSLVTLNKDPIHLVKHRIFVIDISPYTSEPWDNLLPYLLFGWQHMAVWSSSSSENGQRQLCLAWWAPETLQAV